MQQATYSDFANMPFFYIANFFGTIICDNPFVPDEGHTIYLEEKDFIFQ